MGRWRHPSHHLHDAFWSVGEQSFTNVSRGCVNMPPADAEIYYKIAVPGDPVRITGSPRHGVFDNGWTMWSYPGRAGCTAVHCTRRSASTVTAALSFTPPTET